MDDFAIDGANNNNNNNKTPSSWKHIGGTRLEFGNSKRMQFGSLECGMSCNGSSSTNSSVPRRFLAQRIVSWRHQPSSQDEECLLLTQNKSTTTSSPNLDMCTINAMLLSVQSAMVFYDVDDSCRTFVYAPRSLHTASLMEYNNTNKNAPKEVQKEKLKKIAPKRASITKVHAETETNNSTSSASTVPETNDKIEEPATIEAVEPKELEKLYQMCLASNEPTPFVFRQIVAKSLLNKDSTLEKTVCKMLVSSFQIQTNTAGDFDNPRLLPLQVGIRLALSHNTDFLKHHHQVTYKSALSKKSRKKIKKQSPQKVLQEQVLNLLSLLAIRFSDSPVDFREMVQDLCVGVSPDLRHLIFEHFDLRQNEENKEEHLTTNQKRVPSAVTPATTIKTTVMDHSLLPSKEPCLTLPDIHQKKKAPLETDMIVKQNVPLTQSRSSRKNSLVPNQKRKYVGSHFGAGLSNVSSLFRQVQVPKTTTTAMVASKRTTTKPMSIRLEPRRRGGPPPFKRPRTIAFERAKQVITETPAKKLNLYASPHSFSPMPGGSNSQNARRVAQEALAASRRKL